MWTLAKFCPKINRHNLLSMVDLFWKVCRNRLDHFLIMLLSQKQTDKNTQGDHSPDNVKFSDDSLTFPWRFAALLSGTRHVKCYSYHARSSVTVSGWGRKCNSTWSKTIYSTFKTRQDSYKIPVWTQICSLQSTVLGNFSLTRFFPWQFPDFQ